MKKINRVICSIAILFLSSATALAKHCNDSTETKKYPSIGLFKDLDGEYCNSIRERVELLKKFKSTEDETAKADAKKALDENDRWLEQLFGKDKLARIQNVDNGKEDFTPGKKLEKAVKKAGDFVLDRAMGMTEGGWAEAMMAEGIVPAIPKTTGEEKPEVKKQRYWRFKRWNAKRKLSYIQFAHMMDEGFRKDFARRKAILENLKDTKTSEEDAKTYKVELGRIDSQIAVACPECAALFKDAEQVPVEDIATRQVSERKKKESFGEGIPAAVDKIYGIDPKSPWGFPPGQKSGTLQEKKTEDLGAPDGGKVFDDTEGQGDYAPPKRPDPSQPE